MNDLAVSDEFVLNATGDDFDPLADEEWPAVLGYTYDDPPPPDGHVVTIMVPARARQDGWSLAARGIGNGWYLPDSAVVGWRPEETGARNGLQYSVADGFDALTDEELQAVLGYTRDDAPPPDLQIVTIMVPARRARKGGWTLSVRGDGDGWYLPDSAVVRWRPQWAGARNGIEMHREVLRLQALEDAQNGAARPPEVEDD